VSPAPAPSAGDEEAPAAAPDREIASAQEPESVGVWHPGDPHDLAVRLDVAIVSSYFESGELGTADEIRAEIRRLPDLEGFDQKPFFDRWGHVLSYDAMDHDQRRTFEQWLETDRVQAVVGDAIRAAETAVGDAHRR
jgi:hypothetical protein